MPCQKSMHACTQSIELLEQNRKTSEESTQHGKKPIHLPQIRHRPYSSALVIIRQAREGRERRSGGGSSTRRGRRPIGRSRIDEFRVLRTAWVAGAATVLTAGVTLAASGHAVVVFFRAEEVRDRLGVFGGVGGLTVVADAAIGERVLIANKS